jgi:hypothetical protein
MAHGSDPSVHVTNADKSYRLPPLAEAARSDLDKGDPKWRAAAEESSAAVTLVSNLLADTSKQEQAHNIVGQDGAALAFSTVSTSFEYSPVVGSDPRSGATIEEVRHREIDESDGNSSEADDASTVFSTGKYDIFDMATQELQRVLQPHSSTPPDYRALLRTLRRLQDHGPGGFCHGRLSICVPEDHATGTTISGNEATLMTKGYGLMKSSMPGFRSRHDGTRFDIGIANLRKTSSLDLTRANTRCLFPVQAWPEGRIWEDDSRPLPSNEPGFIGEPVNEADDISCFMFRLRGNLKIFEQPVYTDPSNGSCIFRGVMYMDVKLTSMYKSKASLIVLGRGGPNHTASSAFWLLRSKKGKNTLDREEVSHLEYHSEPESSEYDSDEPEQDPNTY